MNMMMQQHQQHFTAAEIPFSPPLSPHNNTTIMNKGAQFHRIRPWPAFPVTSKTSLSNNNLGDATCMEQLLIHCAQAIENNDATPAQQILWVLNNIAPPDGDSNQRLTCAFLRALIVRASLSGTCKMMLPGSTTTTTTTTTTTGSSTNGLLIGNNNMIPHRFSLLELAHFVDLTPWHRFGFTAANSVILDAIGDHHQSVHIIDISVTHCMQIPTLIDALATRFNGQRAAPLLRLTIAALADPQVPPLFDLVSYDELGIRLINFARSRNVSLEFKAVPTSPTDGFASLLEEVMPTSSPEEAVIVNCQMTMHCLQHQHEHQHQTHSHQVAIRSMFLQAVRGLEPDMVVIVEEDIDFTSRNLVERLRAAFNYLWIPFDTVDTFLPRGTKQREWYEADVCWKIENVIAHEGASRVERQEPRAKWAQRMREAGFRGVEFRDEAVAEVKGMLEEHAAGWGSKKEEDDLVLTWKGHNVVFATAWVPTT